MKDTALADRLKAAIELIEKVAADRHPALRGATGELSKQKTPSNAPFCLAQFSG